MDIRWAVCSASTTKRLRRCSTECPHSPTLDYVDERMGDWDIGGDLEDPEPLYEQVDNTIKTDKALARKHEQNRKD